MALKQKGEGNIMKFSRIQKKLTLFLALVIVLAMVMPFNGMAEASGEWYVAHEYFNGAISVSFDTTPVSHRRIMERDLTILEHTVSAGTTIRLDDSWAISDWNIGDLIESAFIGGFTVPDYIDGFYTRRNSSRLELSMINENSATVSFNTPGAFHIFHDWLDIGFAIVVIETAQIQILLDGSPLTFDVPPQTVDGRTLVPLRAIFEALGAEVNWNEATQTITGTKDGTTVVLPLGSTTPTVNGQTVIIDVPGMVQNGRTLVPLRFVAESFGVDVNWDGTNRTVTISSN